VILIELFLGFLEVGCFSFGGAYGAIPLIRDVVRRHDWLSDEVLSHMIAVSESTPGPIMINLATYVGSRQAGLVGALVATLAVVLPSFLVILLVALVMKRFLKNPHIQAVLGGMKPCVMGIILATGTYMCLQNAFPAGGADLPALLILAILVLVMAIYPKLRKKKLSPILLIVISAVLGIVVYTP